MRLLSERQEIHLKRSAKFISFFISLILIFSPVLSVTSGAVTYPAGVTKEQVDSVVPKLSALAKGLFSSMPGTGDIKTSVYTALYSDATVNGLFSSIYSALGENASSLSMLGINLEPSALAKNFSAFPEISVSIAECQDLGAVVAASKNFRWGISNKTDFTNALIAVLLPFNSLLHVVLCSGTLKVNDLISIKGDDGYSTAIVPLLEAFDCPSIMSSADFKASADSNNQNIIVNIVNMLFAAIDNLLADPVNGMCVTLPKIAYYFESGKLSASLTALLEPLSVKIAGVITIPGISDMISSIANMEETLDISSMLADMDMSSLLGSDVNLKLPELDLKVFADCVTEADGKLTVDESASFITLMNFLVETLKLNKDSIGSLLGEDAAALTGILDPLLAKSNDEIIASIIRLFSTVSAPENNVTWTYPAITPAQVTYTPTMGAEDYRKILEKVDPLLTDFIKEEDPEGTIEQTLRKTIYSNALLSQLVTGVFSLLGSEETAGLMGMLGMDMTPSGVASSVASAYPGAANTLRRYSSWESVNPANLYWGFNDGDADKFKAALTKVMSPMIPVLSCLLAGQNVTFLDALTIPGANGYNTAIIPLLEALGCNSDKILSYDEYKKGAGTTGVITGMFDPIFSLIDEICASPVKKLCALLPNIVYFFNSGLMNNLITNLLYPVDYLFQTAGFGSIMTTFAGSMQLPDLNTLMKELTSSADLGISLPEMDIAALASYGTPTTLTSKRTVNGTPAQYTYVTADEPAVLVTILRAFVGALASPENGDMLSGLMGDMGGTAPEGEVDMFAMYMGNITEKLKEMTPDETLEWLCNILFSDSPTVELPAEEEVIPSIKYEKEFELSTTAKLLIVFGVLALAALIYYILSVSGKLDNFKLKRSQKKEYKRRKEEYDKLIKAGADAGSMPAPPSYEEKMLAKARLEQKKKEEKLSKEKNNKNDRRALVKDEQTAERKRPDLKEEKKLEKRQAQAIKRAAKNELKMQKQYAKVLKQATKKK